MGHDFPKIVSNIGDFKWNPEWFGEINLDLTRLFGEIQIYLVKSSYLVKSRRLVDVVVIIVNWNSKLDIWWNPELFGEIQSYLVKSRCPDDVIVIIVDWNQKLFGEIQSYLLKSRVM